MTAELLWFAAVVLVVGGAGVAIGMIVAGRIDRILAPRQAPPPGEAIPPDAGQPEEEQP